MQEIDPSRGNRVPVESNRIEFRIQSNLELIFLIELSLGGALTKKNSPTKKTYQNIYPYKLNGVNINLIHIWI
jgi:hypothetical protein